MHFSFLKFSEAVPKQDRKAFWIAVLCGILSFLLDQWTKYSVIQNIPFGSRNTVIPHFFDLTYITNTGAAWGILAGKGWLLLLISAVVFILALYFIRTLVDGWKERYFAIFLVLSGILGNSFDRVYRGAVVDFLSFYIGKYIWPSFNVADSCICIGVGIYILSSLLRPEHKKGDPDSVSYVQYKN